MDIRKTVALITLFATERLCICRVKIPAMLSISRNGHNDVPKKKKDICIKT